MLYAIFAVLVIILDQGTKLLVSNSVPVETGGETFIPGILSIVHVNNDGAAFSFLAGSGARIFFIILTGVFTIAVIVALATKFISGPLARWSIVLVTAGGISNCIDRVIYGYVVDMFKLEPINFPVFNVADIFITVFALLFVLAIIFERDRRTEDDFLDDDDEEEDDYEEEERPRRLSRKEKRAARYDDEEDEEEDEEEEEPAPKPNRKQRAALRKAAREEEDDEDEEDEPPVELPRPRRSSVKKQTAAEPRSAARAPVTTHTSKYDAEYEQVLARRQQAAAAQTVAPAPAVEVETPAPAPAPVRPAVKPQPAPTPVVEVKPAPGKSAEEFSLDDILAEFR